MSAMTAAMHTTTIIRTRLPMRIFSGRKPCAGCGKNIADVAADVYDMSENTDGSIKGYVVPRNDGYYDFYLFGSGKMKDYLDSTSPLIVDGYNSRVKNLYLSDGVTSIGNYAFYNCSSLTSVEISDSVTSIGVSAFSGCTLLTSVSIGDNVTSLENSAFSGCSALTSITIPDSVASIEEFSFSACGKLTDITIGSGVTNIGRYAFSGYGRGK